MIVLLLLLIATVLAYWLYSETGESVGLFILILIGAFNSDIGLIVGPSIILYYGARRLLV
jgi:hypothetical protein